MSTSPIVHLANAAGGPCCGMLTGTASSELAAVTCWRCNLIAARQALSRALLRGLGERRRAAGAALLALLMVLVSFAPRAAAEDSELGPIKDPFPPAKKEKPVDPCAAPCREVNAKRKACSKATAACESAYREARAACKKACDSAARSARCGGDESCQSTVDSQNKLCCASCETASYELSACAEKDRVCGDYIAARDDTSCRC
jgi:hypothetical protein